MNNKQLYQIRVMRNQLCMSSELIKKHGITIFNGGAVADMPAIQFKASGQTITIVLNEDNEYELWCTRQNGSCLYIEPVYNDELWEQIEYILNNDQKEPAKPATFIQAIPLKIVSKGRLYDLCTQAEISLSAFLEGNVIISTKDLIEVIYGAVDEKEAAIIEAEFMIRHTKQAKLKFLEHLASKLF